MSDATNSPSGDRAATSLRPSSPVAERVQALLAPIVATAEVELLDVEWTGGTLRVVIDHPDGVTTDNLAAVNRLISPILDQHDPVPGRYTLEVSSPGVERPLRRPDHYRRALGETIVVKTVPGVEPRRIKGALRSVTDDDATIDLTVDAVEIDGVELAEPEERTVHLADVTSARTVFDWGPSPKPGKGRKKPGTGKQKKGPGPKPGTATASVDERNEVGDE